MKNIPLLLGTILGTVILIVGLAFFFSSSPSSSSNTATVDPLEVAGDLRNVKGATESAKVTVVEFSDFQCPSCRAARPLADELVKKYPNDVAFVYRHFPLDSIHFNAREAAYAAEAAAEFDKFWPMHDLLFDKQDEWSEVTDDAQLTELFASYAQQLQIDKQQFIEKISDQSIKDRVAADSDAGAKAQVDATPTFFVNGQRTTAPQLMTTVDSMVQNTSAQPSSEQ